VPPTPPAAVEGEYPGPRRPARVGRPRADPLVGGEGLHARL